jgi:hypothetical protein
MVFFGALTGAFGALTGAAGALTGVPGGVFIGIAVDII